MKYRPVITLSFLVVANCAMAAAETNTQTAATYIAETDTAETYNGMMRYGPAVAEALDPVPLATAVNSLSAGELSAKIFSGTVTKVCQKKGCWMILVDGDIYARVTFDDYKTVVPIDITNTQAIVVGRLSETVLSENAQKHYAQDAGLDTKNLTGSKKEYSIVADTVYLAVPDSSVATP